MSLSNFNPNSFECARKQAMNACAKAAEAQSALMGIILAEGDVPEHYVISVRESLAEARALIEMAEAQL